MSEEKNPIEDMIKNILNNGGGGGAIPITEEQAEEFFKHQECSEAKKIDMTLIMYLTNQMINVAENHIKNPKIHEGHYSPIIILMGLVVSTMDRIFMSGNMDRVETIKTLFDDINKILEEEQQRKEPIGKFANELSEELIRKFKQN